MEMSSEALLVLKAKLRHTEYALAQFLSSSKTVSVNDNNKMGEKTSYLMDKNPSEIAKLCQNIAEVVECDANFSSLSSMLSHMDIVCTASLRSFQSLLPEVQSRTFSQRKVILLKILDRYTRWSQNLNQNDYPSAEKGTSTANNEQRSEDKIEDSTNTGVTKTPEETTRGSSNEWAQYSLWYSERRYAMLEIERDFSGFVEDEREKEGRLLRKWIALASPSPHSRSVIDTKGNKKDNVNDKMIKAYISIRDTESNEGGRIKTNEMSSQESEQFSRCSENDCSGSTNRCTSPSTSTPHNIPNVPNNKGEKKYIQENVLEEPSRGGQKKSADKGQGPQGMHKKEHKKDSPTLSPSPSYLHTPRCVAAFIEYYCSYYLAGPYGLGKCSVLTDALRALVEVRSTV